jgi:hypothetical protein
MKENRSQNGSAPQEQYNINDHSEKQFLETVNHGLKHGGIHVNAGKGHGKTRLLFSMAKKENFEDTEYPEEDYPDKTDADLIEFELDTEE